MDDFLLNTTLMGFAARLVAAFVALVVLRAGLWYFDRTLGFDFKEWINDQNKNHDLYFGLRFLGLCIFASSLFS